MPKIKSQGRKIHYAYRGYIVCMYSRYERKSISNKEKVTCKNCLKWIARMQKILGFEFP